MKKILSVAAATLLIAGLSAGTAQAKKRHHSKGMQSMGTAKGSANSMSGKNSPASNATGSASPAGGGEK
ncbi:MAG: hypothetical protein ABWY18_05005 [Tardiphaga sp.]